VEAFAPDAMDEQQSDTPLLHGLCDRIVDVTNLTEPSFYDIIAEVDNVASLVRRRGPKPCTSFKDGTLLYLMWLKTGSTFGALSAIAGVSATELGKRIDHMRGIINKVLATRHKKDLPRPTILEEQPGDLKYAALLVNSTSCPAQRPSGSFQEAKHLWDGKKNMYADKKRSRAIFASAPNKAVFVHEAFPGSKHDTSFFRDTSPIYSDYMRQTPEEARLTSTDEHDS
jgi:hypothetical protein